VKIAITGANSGVGTILLRHLMLRADIDVVACVRSARAAAALPACSRFAARTIDYDDQQGLAAALNGAGPSRRIERRAPTLVRTIVRARRRRSS